MSEQLNPCPFNKRTCLCQACTKNAIYDNTTRGYCIDCYECKAAKKAVHNVYLCTGFEKRKSHELDQCQ